MGKVYRERHITERGPGGCRRFMGTFPAVLHLLESIPPIPDAHRSYLLGLGVKTLLIIPLNLATELIGSLTFRFVEDREFRPEEIEIARALESQAALAIQVTRLAKAARQSAVLQERKRLAGEIHDALAQSFTAICMQLGVAKEELSSKEGDALSRIQRAVELANFGLAEARHCAHNLRLSIVEESGLAVALQRLVERSNIPGRLSCHFRSDEISEESLLPRVKHERQQLADLPKLKLITLERYAHHNAGPAAGHSPNI